MKDINGLKKVLDVFIASLMAISCVTPVMASSECEEPPPPFFDLPKMIRFGESAEDCEVPKTDKGRVVFKCNVPDALEVDSKEISTHYSLLNFTPGAGIIKDGFSFQSVEPASSRECYFEKLDEKRGTVNEYELRPYGRRNLFLDVTVKIPNTVEAWQGVKEIPNTAEIWNESGLLPGLIAQQAAKGDVLHIPAGAKLKYTTFDGMAPDTLQRFKTVVFDGDVIIDKITNRQTLYYGKSGIGAFREFKNLENYIVEGRDYKTEEEAWDEVDEQKCGWGKVIVYSYHGQLCALGYVNENRYDSKKFPAYALLSCPKNMKFKDSVFVLPGHIQTIGAYAISGNPNIECVDARKIKHTIRHAIFDLPNLRTVYTERCYRIDVVNCPNYVF